MCKFIKTILLTLEKYVPKVFKTQNFFIALLGMSSEDLIFIILI